jgi:hypothetical protein
LVPPSNIQWLTVEADKELETIRTKGSNGEHVKDPKLEKSLYFLAGSYPTLGQLRAAKPFGSAAVINSNKDRPDSYPSVRAVTEFLSPNVSGSPCGKSLSSLG